MLGPGDSLVTLMGTCLQDYKDKEALSGATTVSMLRESGIFLLYLEIIYSFFKGCINFR